MAPRQHVNEPWPASGGGERLASAYDLVEQMHYLYVRVVRARGLPATASNVYVEARLGNYRGATPARHYHERKAATATTTPEWNQVFAFSREPVQATALEVFVREEKGDAAVGKIAFDVAEAPVRVPPDSPLAPQWYRLDGGRGGSGEVMLAVWVGTQADEAFADAWHADAASTQSTRSKVYVTPKLWYLRITVLEAQDVAVAGAGDKAGRHNGGEAFVVKVQVGGMMLRTKPCSPTTMAWNEEMVFVVAEPFDEPAVLVIESRSPPPPPPRLPGNGKDKIVARAVVPLTLFEKRLDRRPPPSQWFSLEPFGHRLATAATGRVHIRACLDGAYHVMDEPAMYASDTRPTARQLWRPPIGVLEVGVLGAQGLPPMKTADVTTTDAYCVAKYGHKWVRTRTVVDSCSPRWNEQYTWEVYDPCTVLTLAVFDNRHLGHSTTAAAAKDERIGKVRIRLSTLEMDRVYTNWHSLAVLHPSTGTLRRNGEIRLAVRLTCLSLASVVRLYAEPILPRAHYAQPIAAAADALRRQAMSIVASRLGRAEPPLRREVVEYMLDAGSHLWSIRKSKANFFRVTALLAGGAGAARWLAGVCNWRSPATTILVHVLLVTFVCFPELILPTAFLYVSAIGVWNYRRRPRRPAQQADARLSCAEATGADELDEELDTFPTSRGNGVVRVRYDRLRTVAGRIQTVVGDVATQGERVRSLLAWRDPRATAVFTALCLVAAVVVYVTPFRVVALVAGLYLLRHPRFRSRMPSAAGNFFKRLPSRADTML
uniref:C2 domain-containing protein n=1 Tax=Leersia perrieri TaxID=77586 RepID=A0A0D9W657_9ORYZ